MSNFNLLYNPEKVYKRTTDYTPPLISKLTAFMRIMPDFFIGGIQKGGTTSLYYSLIQHAQIIPGKTKEMFYYGVTPNYQKGTLYYKQHFGTGLYKTFTQLRTGKKMFTVDASTNTFDSKEAPSRILQDKPNAKIIFIFRDPVERAYSHYKMARRMGWESADFETALKLEESRIIDGTKHPLSDPLHNYAYQRLGYRSRGMYAVHLKRWLDEFPNDQIMIINSESFFNDPENILASICKFIGVDEAKNIDFKKMNEGSSDAMLPETRQMLKDFFKPHNEAFFSMINERFNW
jgi:hypothetical protein